MTGERLVDDPADAIADGFRRDGAFRADGTVVPCVDPAGRRWTLVRVPDDCRHGRGLHPLIRDRLARVRDLPHPRVATLAGVVRGTGPDGAAYLVWADVPDARPLADLMPTAAQLGVLARRLATAVDLLHARGLVHGNLSAGTVLVTPGGDVWLTGVSPYLWDDPAADGWAVRDLLRPIAAAAGLTVPDDPTMTPGDLADHWATPAEPPAPVAGRRSRARPLATAATLAVAAVTFVITMRQGCSPPADDRGTRRAVPLVDPGR